MMSFFEFIYRWRSEKTHSKNAPIRIASIISAGVQFIRVFWHGPVPPLDGLHKCGSDICAGFDGETAVQGEMGSGGRG